MILLICCCCSSHFFQLVCKGWIFVMGFCNMAVVMHVCVCVWGALADDLCMCGTWQCVYLLLCVRTVVSVFMRQERLLCACLMGSMGLAFVQAATELISGHLQEVKLCILSLWGNQCWDAGSLLYCSPVPVPVRFDKSWEVLSLLQKLPLNSCRAFHPFHQLKIFPVCFRRR